MLTVVKNALHPMSFIYRKLHTSSSLLNIVKLILASQNFFYFFILINLVLAKLQDAFTDFRNSK